VLIAGCGRNRISFFEDCRGGRELSSENKQTCAVGQPDGKRDQGAGIPREPNSVAGELMPGLVVPQLRGDAKGEAHLAPDDAILAEQCLHCFQVPPWRRHACRVAVSEPGHETVKEEIERP
jgi:hypothetical protein